MKKLMFVPLLLLLTNGYGWKEPAWTQTDASRTKHSDVVFVGTIKSLHKVPVSKKGLYISKAIVHVEKVTKNHKLLKSGMTDLFFERSHVAGPDRGWVSLSTGQMALFYARVRKLDGDKNVLFLDFQSDVQKP